MKHTTRSICSSLISAPVLRIAALAITASSAHAATFTWDGSTDTWPSVHWLDSGSVLVVGGTGAAITDTYTINSGTVSFTDHDTFGAAAANPLLTINVNGGTLSNEAAAFGQAFTTLGLVNLTDGTITSTGGANSNFQAFQFKNTVTSSGASFINTTGTPANFNGFHVTNNIFDVTGGTLTVSAPLLNAAGGAAAGFTKTGAGTMTLSGVNGLTGSVVSSAGTLDVATGGSLTNISVLNSKSGGAVTISGTVTIGNAGSFGVGAGAASTTGSVTLNTGGVLNVGNGGGFVGVGGKDASGSGLGNGTLTIAGGTMNVAAPGTGTSAATGLSGQAGGLDATNFWMNPYGTGGGTSTINLDGGTLATARAIARGSTSNAIFNFNGGTLQATAATAGVIFNGLTRVNIRNGGGTIDTMANNFTVAQPLLHSDIGGDNATDGGLTKVGAGTLTLTSNANTYTGNVVVNAGTLALQAGSLGPAPTTSVLGNPNTAERTVTINAGGTVQYRQHDQLGNDAANPQLTYIVNGGTLMAATGSQASGNGPFNILPAVTLNGGSLTSANGAFAQVQSFSLKGDITVTGSTSSTINTTGTAALLNGIHLTKAGGVGFNVADVTGSSVTDLSVSAPLISGANGAGAGILNKTGAGTMSLDSASTYTGATNINGGTLLLNGSLPAANAVNVANGAGFGRTTTDSTTIGSLTLGALAGDTSTLTFAANSTLVVGNANGLVANGGAGTVTVNVTGAAPAIGTYTLLDYDGTLGGGSSSFVLGSLPARTLATLVHNSGSTSFVLDVTGVDSARWSGALGSAWTTGTLDAPKNWVLHSNGVTTTDYIEGDTVHFTDSAVGTAVDITGADVSPASVTFNATQSFTLTGTHGIAGSAALTKSGSGTLAINNVNSYTGGTAIGGGVIQIVSGGLGTTGNISFGGGSLRYAAGNTQDLSARISNSTGVVVLDTNGNNVTFAGGIGPTNTGGVTKDGAGTLTINGVNSFGGAMNVNGGTVLMSNAGSNFTGALNINSGATVEANVSGGGATSALGQANVARTITINTGGTLRFSNHDVFGNVAVTPVLTVVVDGGAVINAQAPSLGPAFTTFGPLILNNGTVTSTGGAIASHQAYQLKGTVTSSGASAFTTTGGVNNGFHVTNNTFDVTSGTLAVSAPLINAPANTTAGFTKTGAGTMLLSAVNAYTGATNVAAGTLVVTGSISGSDVQVESGATLGGTGAAKTLWVKPGGTFSPGTSVGTFTTIGGDILLEGISNFELTKSGFTLGADLAVSNTAIVYGGTLNVTASGDPLASGDVFNLFDAPDLGGNLFSTLNLPSLGGGLTWDTSGLTVNGTITVVPEPGSAALLLAGLGLLVRRRREQP